MRALHYQDLENLTVPLRMTFAAISCNMKVTAAKEATCSKREIRRSEGTEKEIKSKDTYVNCGVWQTFGRSSKLFII